MAEGVLPTGTVAFLFTDIEGSTKLWDAHRDAMARAVADHDALAAAVAGQEALAANAWPDGIEIRVRMGLHTGEPAVGDEGYVGLDVVRAARICGAAHGGQVLVSETTKALVPEAEFRDLGAHRLKDLERDVSLYQLVVPGRPADFPAPRTEAPALPLAAPGRELELARQAEEAAAEITASVEQSVAKMLTAIPGPDFDPLAAARPPAPPTPRPPRRSRFGRLFRRGR